ncbi:mitofusin [Tulasnella sp. 425]|nr:mitofusin [Tulasnella sp. 425]
MAQSYFPASASAPVVGSSPTTEEIMKETNFGPADKVAAAKGDDVEATYLEQTDRITGAIDDTKAILTDVRQFNKLSWIVRYPQFRPASPSPPNSPNKRRPSSRHSLSFADEPAKEIDVVSSRRKSMKRSLTLASVADEPTEEADPTTEDAPNVGDEEGLIPTDFQILRLDLKLGPHGASTSAGGLVSQLEKASIANLIDERIGHSLNHLDKLRTRIVDKSSKVLVTGDLNAGKSTLVNAFLKREVMPVDQQPCTSLFCEVHDASENDGVEEAHLIDDCMSKSYNREDESTFTRVPMSEVEEIVSDSDGKGALKIYLKDSSAASQSLLGNGVVNISLIDAPGLNRDSFHTTEIFSRQEEIDVVVFVVSAENHFTLSAKEFLFNASNEKSYIFVVVNKFDGIKDKAKCKRLILDQIKQVSPKTWKEADDLVHFVDSKSALARAAFPDAEPPKSSVPQETFDTMLSGLRSFVLTKRAKSKFMPVTTYLRNIISDLELLLSTNRIVADADIIEAKEVLDRARPELERMEREKQELEEGLGNEEDEAGNAAYHRALALLEQALERVGNGEIAVDSTLVNRPSPRLSKATLSLPSYPGILHVWQYARAVRKTLLSSLDLAVALAEDEARSVTGSGVDSVFKLADAHLPPTAERANKVFAPEAMFSRIRGRTGRKGQAVVAGGVHGLGIGLAQRSDLMEVSYLDVFAVHHHLAKMTKNHDGDHDSFSPWGLASIGLTAVTMVGGSTAGLRSFIEGLAHIGDIFGNEQTRKWVVPAVGVATVGLGAYVVLELPKTIPKSIGLQIKSSLTDSELHQYHHTNLVTPQPGFAEGHAQRIAKETRKVLRIAAWDTRSRFCRAMDERGAEVKTAEEEIGRATTALKFFDSIEERTDAVRVKAELDVVA